MAYSGQHECPACGKPATLAFRTKERRAYYAHEEIGRGGFGKVYRGHAVGLAQVKDVAVKVVHRSALEKANCPEQRVFDEIAIQTRVNNANVVGVHDGFFDQNEKAYVLVTELCMGDLARVLESRGEPLTEEEARLVVRDVALALSCLHRNNITHRDVKLANVLIGRDGKYKLGDFGLAVQEETVGKGHLTMCGTPSALAPEVATGQRYTRSVDMWGLGIALYTLLVGRSPFEDQRAQNCHRVAVQNIVSLDPWFPKNLSPHAIHLVNGLLQKVRQPLLTEH